MSNQIIGIFGKKGYGKTYLTKKDILPQFQRKIILDKNAEYFGGFIFTNYQKFSEYYFKVQKNNERNFTDILRFLSIEDYEEFFTEIESFSKTTIIIDEANFFFPSTGTNRDVKNMIAISRHLQINIIFLSRRVYEVSPLLRSQADIIYTFYQNNSNDLQELKDAYGFIPDEISSLPKYQYKMINIGD